MPKSNLYIIEGLPCSGKSLTSKYVSDVLKSHGKNVIYVDEGTGNHPADYEFHSFISKKSLSEFSEQEQKIILGCSEQKCDGYIVALSALSGELFEKALKYKIYDFLDWNTEKNIMLEKWREFSKSGTDSIYVFNCCLLQNPMCETMMRFGFDIQTSKEYIMKICDIIKPLNPSVIYLANSNIEQSIRKAVPERGMEWLNNVIEYHINGGYGKSKELKGFDGYISCLEERQKRELQILDNLPVHSLVIKNAQADWNHSYDKIQDFIID